MTWSETPNKHGGGVQNIYKKTKHEIRWTDCKCWDHEEVFLTFLFLSIVSLFGLLVSLHDDDDWEEGEEGDDDHNNGFVVCAFQIFVKVCGSVEVFCADNSSSSTEDHPTHLRSACVCVCVCVCVCKSF